MIDESMKSCDLCGNAGKKEKCNVCGRNRLYGDMFVLDGKVKAYIAMTEGELANGKSERG